MKVSSLKAITTPATKTTVTYQQFDRDMKVKLNGKTIREAIAANLITDMGNEKGEFSFQHADDNIEATYAVLNGTSVARLSTALADEIEAMDDADILDLKFKLDISTQEGEGLGKEYFVLGKPQSIRLGAVTKTLESAEKEPA